MHGIIELSILLDNSIMRGDEALMTGLTTDMTVASMPRRGSLRARAVENELDSGVALWRRAADELERAIAAGSFQPGSKLPGELDLAERFGVNRHTVRRAIAALAERGMLRDERGSGTYVEAQRLTYPIHKRTRFTEIVATTGRAADGRLTASAMEGADAEVAKRLRLRPGASVIRLELLRHADRVPICASTSWLPAERFAGAAKVFRTARSITRMLAHFGVHDYIRQSTQITAAIADAADALPLEIAPGRPVLVVDSVDADRDDIPILTKRTRFAADRIELIVET
jgi:GntR family transcriptional regulator, phosphonate transport system regulatory protein